MRRLLCLLVLAFVTSGPHPLLSRSATSDEGPPSRKPDDDPPGSVGVDASASTPEADPISDEAIESIDEVLESILSILNDADLPADQPASKPFDPPPTAPDAKHDSEPTLDLHQSWFSSDDKAGIIAYLAQRSDDELEQALDTMLSLADFRSRSGYEPCLTEIGRRGGKHWESVLQEKLDALEESEVKPYEGADEVVPGAQFNLELLTALRRVRNQPDPLHIFIVEPKDLNGAGSALPNLKVRITNVDVEQVGVGFTVGGNYRAGRQARWRILVQDEEGHMIPARGRLSIFGGGVFTEEILEYGQAWETSLHVHSFIEVPPPGEYMLTVQYHNTQTIAGETDIDGLIVSRSNAVPFVVKPLTIVHSKEDRDSVRKWIAELDGNERLKVVVGNYGEGAHEFIPPDSPQGKLLGMGLAAAPTIIESLHDEKLTKEKRAWLLGILFSLTSENDPTQTTALGSYEYWESGWQIWGGRTDEAPSGGLSFGSKGSFSGIKIDRNTQATFVAEWDHWLRKVEVKEPAIARDMGGQGDEREPK